MRRPVSVRVFCSGHFPEPLARQLLALTRRCDGDFVPPLSWRHRLGQEIRDLGPQAGANVEKYVDSLLELAHLVVLVQDERLVGHCAYYWPWMWRGTEHVYVSTAVVAPSHRDRGLSTRMGRRVVARALRRRVPLLAKTWSTNQAWAPWPAGAESIRSCATSAAQASTPSTGARTPLAPWLPWVSFSPMPAPPNVPRHFRENPRHPLRPDGYVAAVHAHTHATDLVVDQAMSTLIRAPGRVG